MRLEIFPYGMIESHSIEYYRTGRIIMKAYSVQDIGGIVRNARKRSGLTQQDLADFCGCGVRFISELERGKETVEMGRALRVLNVLGLDMDVVERQF